MRIIDWSSDVCSSELRRAIVRATEEGRRAHVRMNVGKPEHPLVDALPFVRRANRVEADFRESLAPGCRYKPELAGQPLITGEHQRRIIRIRRQIAVRGRRTERDRKSVA